jgi:hypothetical protein
LCGSGTSLHSSQPTQPCTSGSSLPSTAKVWMPWRCSLSGVLAALSLPTPSVAWASPRAGTFSANHPLPSLCTRGLVDDHCHLGRAEVQWHGPSGGHHVVLARVGGRHQHGGAVVEQAVGFVQRDGGAERGQGGHAGTLAIDISKTQRWWQFLQWWSTVITNRIRAETVV